jgi:hypothetical protein
MQDFFETAEPRFVGFMLITIVLLIGAVEGTYLLWPQVKQYRQLHSSHEMLELTVGDHDSLSQQLQSIDAEVSRLSRELHGDMARLPVKQMESFIIGRLQKVSWATDVELISVQPGLGRQVQNFRESLFEVRLRAGYHDFFEWLQIVKHELGYIVVKRFEISHSDNEALENPKLNLLLTLVSYRMELEHAS